VGSGRLSRERAREREREDGEKNGMAQRVEEVAQAQACLVHGIGAGWSTSIGPRTRSFVSFHPGLIALHYGRYYYYIILVPGSLWKSSLLGCVLYTDSISLVIPDARCWTHEHLGYHTVLETPSLCRGYPERGAIGRKSKPSNISADTQPKVPCVGSRHDSPVPALEQLRPASFHRALPGDQFS